MPTPENLVYIEVADANGYIGRTDAFFDFDPSGSITSLLAAVSAFLVLVQNCSDGRIVKAQARLAVDVSAFDSRPIPDSAAASECLTLSFANNGADSLPWDFLVPAVSTSVLSGGRPDMGEGGTIDVLADTMENLTPPDPAFVFITNRGGALAPTAGGFLAIRKRDRLFARSTMVVVP